LLLDAIEPNADWALHARPLYRRVFDCTVEQAIAQGLAPGGYDAIVCADVLEHVPDPAAVLKALQQAAAPGATFIISVPNVAHIAVRFMLMFGYFPAMDRGILDRTHLHFYTKDTAADMLKSTGLRIEAVYGTGVPLDEVFKRGEGKWWFNLLTRSQHLALSVAPRLTAMQWVFVAKMA